MCENKYSALFAIDLIHGWFSTLRLFNFSPDKENEMWHHIASLCLWLTFHLFYSLSYIYLLCYLHLYILYRLAYFSFVLLILLLIDSKIKIRNYTLKLFQNFIYFASDKSAKLLHKIYQIYTYELSFECLFVSYFIIWYD